MKIVFLGAGRLANQLLPALQESGCKILQIYNRTLEDAILLAQKCGGIPTTSSIGEIDTNADAYFITVSDDAVKNIAEELREVVSPKALLVHCSGMLDMDILPNERRASFYPLQSFSDNHDVSFRYIPIIVTTHDDDIWIMLEQVAAKISSAVYRMTDAQKSILHLSAVFANNFSNHMLTIAQSICNDHGIPFEMLKPLILETFSKAILSGPKESQTGPAIRGDQHTIEKHLSLLSTHPTLKNVYNAVTDSIQKK